MGYEAKKTEHSGTKRRTEPGQNPDSDPPAAASPILSRQA